MEIVPIEDLGAEIARCSENIRKIARNKARRND
jgi:hypothetical protein